MRAAVVRTPAAVPELTDFQEPRPEDAPARVVAAALNPVDLISTAGLLPFRPFQAPGIAGIEGVAEDAAGTLRYFFAPVTPFGAFAERVPLRGAETAAVPAGLDPVVAASLGVSGVAAFLALTRAGALTSGQSVLVLGATGAVGRLAVQIARELGAGLVIGTARSDAAADTVRRLDVKSVVTADPTAYAGQLTALAPEGVDLVIDMLWGTPLASTLPHIRPGGRIVQVGNSAGAQATIAAPVFRNRGLTLVGHSNFFGPASERMDAFESVATLAANGRLRLETERIGFDKLPDAWARLASGLGASRKTVVAF